jgi:formylglycine-generating enzyme required for sulfatase activity
MRRIRVVLVWVCALLSIAVVALAVRSFWRCDEAAWCTWKPDPASQGIDHRIVAGSYRGGVFLLSTTADIPAATPVDWYGGEPRETIFRSAPGARLADSALKASGGSSFRPAPRWLWGGFNLHSEGHSTALAAGKRSPGNGWVFASLVVPYWVPFLVLLLPAAGVLRRRRLLLRRRKHGLCLYCGYDLRASGPICSECGQLRAELRPEEPPRKPVVSRRVLWRACGIMTASLALVWLVCYVVTRPESAVRLDRATVLSADHLPGRVEIDLGKGVALRFALIPAGRFKMGSPAEEVGRGDWGDDETQHEVKISKPFYMGVMPITQEQYQAVMGTNPSSSEFKGPKIPVTQVSWDDAEDFCKKVSDRTGRKVYLPTEAQWEYACRAGTNTPFNTGRTLPRDRANYWVGVMYPSNRAGEAAYELLPAGSFKPNAWGLYDMHGSMWEWCADYYGQYTGAGADPTGPKDGSLRVLRGGSWYYSPWLCRSAYRLRYDPLHRYDYIGFRVAVASAGVD